MSFINPFLIIGILAAGIPLLIHLWSRRQARPIDFSHVQFLMSLHRSRVRRLKLKQIFILILRMLIVALIALALARPILTSKWALAAGGRANSSVVIVLDNSYSMGYERFDGTRFDIAKDRALRLLESLRPGDNASLILMSDLPEVVFRRLTSDIQQVRDAVKNAKLSHRSSHVWSAISEAYVLLSESDHPRKSIYLISDLGKNGWQDWREIPDDSGMVDVFVIRIGEAEAGNRAVESVAPSNDPVAMGIPVKISAKLAGSDLAGETKATVELFVDGEKKGQAAVRESVSFTHIFEHPGIHIGEVRLTSDRLALDDARYFAIDVAGQIRTLCAGKNNFYVNLALNPVTSLDPEAEFSILPAGCTVEELDAQSLDQYNVVVLADVAKLSEDVAGNMENFVLNGGSLVIFLGENADRDWYNNQFDLIPATLGDKFSQARIKLSKWDENHPIFKVFGNEDTRGTLDSLQFYSAFSLKPKDGAKVIASFDRDIPAVLETESGWGRVILFNTSPDTKVSDLPINPAFLPLMQQAVLYLTSEVRKSNRNIFVGDTYLRHLQNSTDSPPVVFDPEGNKSTSAMSADERGDQIQYGPAEHAGIYRLEFKSGGRLYRDYFAANPDVTRESDLEAARDGEIMDKLGERARFLSLDDSPDEITRISESGREFSSRLLIAAAILMLMEIPLANRRRIT